MHKIFHIGLLVAGLGCQSPAPANGGEVIEEKPMDASALSPITKMSDLDGLDQQPVKLVGTYVLIDVRMRLKPPPRYKGHAAIDLEGGRVFLEPIWAPEAIRPEAEQALNGQTVEVVGRFFKVAPSSPRPAAEMVVSCLRPVQSVKVLPSAGE